MLATAEFLSSAASPGYCEQTQLGQVGQGDCIAGLHGSWGLKLHEATSLESAAESCLTRCASCDRCFHITVSKEWAHCSWHYECPQPHFEDAPHFFSGRARKMLPHSSQSLNATTVNNGSPNEKKPHESKRSVLSPISRTRYDFKACPKGAALPPTAEVKDWTTSDSVRVNFLSGFAAMKHAACCGGVGILPRISFDEWQSSQKLAESLTMAGLIGVRKKACYSFEHIPSVAATRTQCAPRRFTSHAFLSNGAQGSPCPAVQYYAHPAMLALTDYLKLGQTPCQSDIDYENTLIAHIKTMDNPNEFEDGIMQPPLSYFLSAWTASQLSKLIVIVQSDNSPDVKLLQQLSRVVPGISIRHSKGLRSNLAALMCARHLALSRSSWHSILLMNKRLQRVYTATPLAHAVTSSCATTILAPSHDRVTDGDTLGGAEWLSLAAQKLDLSTKLWNHTIAFKMQAEPHVPCLTTRQR